MPVGLNGKYGFIEAAIIGGSAPLLLGRPTLEKLNVHLDFQNNKIKFLGLGSRDMHTNEAGQIVIDLMQFPPELTVQVEPSVPSPSTTISGCSIITASSTEPLKPKDGGKRKVTLKEKECRCLLAHLHKHDNGKQSKVLVAELLSSPGFSKIAESMGKRGLAYDKKQGCDLLDRQIQMRVSQELGDVRPELLVVCPPCTHEGGWENLNQFCRTPMERARLIRDNKKRLRFCVDQIHNQWR